MPKFTVTIRRVEEWVGHVTVTAPDQFTARRELQAMLDKDGWTALFDDDDGEYVDCSSTVTEVTSAADTVSADLEL